MTSLTQSFIDIALAGFGIPAPCSRILNKHQGLIGHIDVSVNKTINARNVPDWSVWSNDKNYLNNAIDKSFDFEYEDEFRFPENFKLVNTVDLGEVVIDIRNVHGVEASKSDLNAYSSLDEMAKRTMRSLRCYAPDSEQFLRACLSHAETQCFRPHGHDYFTRTQWDQNVYLINSSGSHHFAAARYLAKELGVDLPVYGRLYDSTLNTDAVRFIDANFEIYVLNGDASGFSSFVNAIRIYNARFALLDMPNVFGRQHALLLHKTNSRAMRVASLFRKANAFDLVKYFKKLPITSKRFGGPLVMPML